MDLFAVFASALLIGLSIAAPVGPIGLLTIQRSLEHGTRAGLATGLGAAAAERARLEFTWDRVASAYDDLYRRLLAVRSPAPAT